MHALTPTHAHRIPPDGVRALKRVIDYIPVDIPVLLDAKRGDIGSTCTAYASAAYGDLNADGITLSASGDSPQRDFMEWRWGPRRPSTTLDPRATRPVPSPQAYMGYDSVEPFVKPAAFQKKAVFLLCKTSNKSSNDLQTLPLGGAAQGKMLFEHMAALAQQWNGACDWDEQRTGA